MIARIKLPIGEIKQMLDSLDAVFAFTDDDSLTKDLNIVLGESRAQIYMIPDTNNIAVYHELSENDEISLEIKEGSRLVFNIETLEKIVNKADQGTIELEFCKDEYKVKYEEEGEFFSEPITYDLRIFSESEFKELPSRGETEKIGETSPISLYKAFDLLSPIAEIVRLEKNENKLSIKAEDVIEGEGNVVGADLEASEVDSFSELYPVRPIKEFLKEHKDIDKMELFVNQNGFLTLRSRRDGITSELFITNILE
jgi:hypothetical protein